MRKLLVVLLLGALVVLAATPALAGPNGPIWPMAMAAKRSR